MLPDNPVVVDIESFKENNNIRIKGKDSYFSETYYIDRFIDEKDTKNFIKCVENEVRRSNEYAKYLGSLKQEGLNTCAILGNVEEDSKVTIEFHHYPFTLFDIVWAVIDKRLALNEPVNTFLVAKEVINLHFTNKVGLVPLCKTVHELAHDGKIFINLNLVYGRYDTFLEEYDEYIPKHLKLDYNKLVQWTEENRPYSDCDILHIKEKEGTKI